jgi:putative peptidoglycan lipid II flippase
VRVGLGLVLSALLALWLPRQLGLGRVWGAAGITLASSLAGWVEYALLRRSMHRRIGRTAIPGALLARLWGAAMLAGGAGYGAKLLLGPGAGNVMRGLIALGVFAAGYGGLTLALGVPEARSLAGRALARVRR